MSERTSEQATATPPETKETAGDQAKEAGRFAEWGVVQIMDDKVYAGYMTEEQIAGAMMLRVDVPQIDHHPAFTKYFSAAAIFDITPCSEELAMDQARGLRTGSYHRPTVASLPAYGADEDLPY